MQAVNWGALPGVAVQVLINILGICLVLTLVGTIFMKVFPRSIPVYRLAIICFLAHFRVLMIVFVLSAIVILGQINVPHGLSGIFALSGMCAIGWLITHDLGRYGISKKFPGIGAKVVIGIFALTWIAVGLYYASSSI